MKLLMATIFAGVLAVSTTACAKEEPKQATTVAAPKAEAPAAAPETRKVCLDVKDKAGQPVKNKDGSVKQNCKIVKAHKKHEGTKIEDAKKK